MISKKARKEFLEKAKENFEAIDYTENPWALSTIGFSEFAEMPAYEIIKALEVPEALQETISRKELQKLRFFEGEELFRELRNEQNECGLHVYWDLKSENPETLSIGLYYYGGGDIGLIVPLNKILSDQEYLELRDFGLERLSQGKDERDL